MTLYDFGMNCIFDATGIKDEASDLTVFTIDVVPRQGAFYLNQLSHAHPIYILEEEIYIFEETMTFSSDESSTMISLPSYALSLLLVRAWVIFKSIHLYPSLIFRIPFILSLNFNNHKPS